MPSNIQAKIQKLLNRPKKNIYLDHAATTYVDPRVKKKMEPYFTEKFGNPSAFYDIGLEAKIALDQARKQVADILHANPQEIVFVGSGTESDNLAILGTARANKDKGNHIITTKIEHHAVLDACKELENEGFEVTYLNVDKYGLIDLKALEKAITKKTILVSIMYANNEIGTIQPIKEIAKITKKKGVYFHTDACQAGCSLSLNINELGVDLLTLNGSKIYGPKGTGMLYVKSGVKIKPIIFGGGQEGGLRSGTENVPGIVGFAEALYLAQKERLKESKRLTMLRDKLIKKLVGIIPKSFLNGHPTKRLPNNANLSILDIEGEAMILFLNELGIYTSTGSACTSGSLDPSHVILALGLPYEAAHGSLRMTLGRRTTEKDVDYLILVLPQVVEILRRISPLDLRVREIKKEKTIII